MARSRSRPRSERDMAGKSTQNSEARPAFFPEWAEPKRMSQIGIVSFALLILLCLMIIVPLSVTMNQTDGNCFLYADTYGYGAASICEYCIACAVMLLVLSFVRFGLLLWKIYYEIRPIVDKVAGWCSLYGVHPIILCLDVVVLLLLLVMACLLSVGTAHLCNSLFGDRSKCAEHDGIILPNEEVNRSFYSALTIAEASAWCAFVFWLLLVIFETLVAWKKQTLRPVLDRITSSMTRTTTK